MPGHIARIETMLHASVETDVETDAGERRVERDEDELSAIKGSPGNVSPATVLSENRQAPGRAPGRFTTRAG